jgi:multidrug efflux pump subunit AcrA (membrane-fusion protein)
MESLPLPFAQLIIQILGLPGLIFIIWHFDNKRLDKQREQYEREQLQLREAYEKERKLDRDAYEKERRLDREQATSEHRKDRDQTQQILNQYRDDIASIKGLYQNNAHLVKDYDLAMNRLEKMASEMMSVVSLNAQTNTQLADAIKNNTFCPTMRDLMGKKS